ncbi:MAG: hypothetical protein MUC97_08960 [Bernardetiaceae bacterium]|jgi:hypothetical protein|nr:hypothetical protein [Bernardetiaceae bacterium]
MKQLGIILAPTAAFMGLYFLLATLLIERPRVRENEENQAEETPELTDPAEEPEEETKKRVVKVKLEQPAR